MAYCICLLVYLVGVDECALGTDDCSQYAICTDTDSSYYCTCSQGFTGDGRTCSGKWGMLHALANSFLSHEYVHENIYVLQVSVAIHSACKSL